MKNVSEKKSSRENQNPYLMFNNFFPENHVVYEMTWANVVEPDWLHMTILMLRKKDTICMPGN